MNLLGTFTKLSEAKLYAAREFMETTKYQEYNELLKPVKLLKRGLQFTV